MKTYDAYRQRVENALGPMLESLGEIPEQPHRKLTKYSDEKV